MPANTVKVDRATKWGNPFKQAWFTRQQQVAAYYEWFNCSDSMYGKPPDVSALRGKDLACWCPLSEPCHADVLLEIANGG